MLKNILLFTVSAIIGTALVVSGYLWDAPRNSRLLVPFFPKTYFSIENAPKQSLTGKLTSISGKISWQSRAADQASPISFPIKLQQGEELETQDNGKGVIDFSGVGKITVFANTQVSIVQTLPVNFVVEQKSGLATYDKNGSVPLSIRALDLLINMGEGSCTVSVDKVSSNITISVASGSAKAAFNDTSNNTNIVTVKQGEKYLFNNNGKLGKIRFF